MKAGGDQTGHLNPPPRSLETKIKTEEKRVIIKINNNYRHLNKIFFYPEYSEAISKNSLTRLKRKFVSTFS
jgi:hypothetical protein